MWRTYALISLFCLLLLCQTGIRAQEIVVPAGTLLHCTLDEPNFSSATADIGDPAVCHLGSLQQFFFYCDRDRGVSRLNCFSHVQGDHPLP